MILRYVSYAFGFGGTLIDLIPILIPLVAIIFWSLVALTGIIGGVGLLKRKAWARVVAMIFAVVSLLNIPIGTAFGVYAIWVLRTDETTSLLVTGHGAEKTTGVLEKFA